MQWSVIFFNNGQSQFGIGIEYRNSSGRLQASLQDLFTQENIRHNLDFAVYTQHDQNGTDIVFCDPDGVPDSPTVERCPNINLQKISVDRKGGTEATFSLVDERGNTCAVINIDQSRLACGLQKLIELENTESDMPQLSMQ